MVIQDSIDGKSVTRVMSAGCNYAAHALAIGQGISPCPTCGQKLNLRPQDKCEHGGANRGSHCGLCRPIEFILSRKSKTKWDSEPEGPEEISEEIEEQGEEEEIFKEAEEEEE